MKQPLATVTPKYATHSEQWYRANNFACRWLADANEAEERGALKTAEKCLEKAQYWLDRLNKLDGLS